MTDIELLPLTDSFTNGFGECIDFKVEDYARAVAEHNVEKLRRERDAAVYALANTERSLAAARKARDLFADRAALRAEVERWKVPCREWLEKTEWVQQTCKPKELGMHRADIMRLRLEQAEARAERLAEALRGMLDEYAALHAKYDLGDCQATVDARAALRDHDQEVGNG